MVEATGGFTGGGKIAAAQHRERVQKSAAPLSLLHACAETSTSVPEHAILSTTLSYTPQVVTAHENTVVGAKSPLLHT